MKDTNDKGYPKKKAGDAAHALVKGTISSVPYVGGLASEIFSLVIAPSIEKRRDDWFRSIGERLSELEEKAEGFNIENLKGNESFVTTFTNATILALRTHQEEKLETLRNAIINAALPGPPEDDIQILFLHFVDAFTTHHIKILDLLNDPYEWANRHNLRLPNSSIGNIEMVVSLAFPDFKAQKGFYEMLINDLYSRGLIRINSSAGLYTTQSFSGVLSPHTTPLGVKFLTFIANPFINKNS